MLRTLVAFVALVILNITWSTSSLADTTSASDLALGKEGEIQLQDKLAQYESKLEAYEFSTADKQGIWLPEGFFSGPSSDDLAYRQLQMIFGAPVIHVFNSITSTESSEIGTTQITLATMYAKVMNSIGMIIINITVIFSTIGFFTKRSLDVSYLTPQKEEVMPFMLARGTGSVLVSYPIPVLGGLSLLQGFTLSIIILGLGMAASIIRLSIPFMISPGLTFNPQSNVANFVDFVLEAKTCAVAMAKVDGQDADSVYTSSSYSVTEKNQILRNNLHGVNQSEKTRKIAYFGVNGSGDCGSIVLANYVKPPASKMNNLEEVSNFITAKAVADQSSIYVDSIWTNSLINDIATLLNKSGQSEITDAQISDYVSYRLAIQEQMQGAIINEIRAQLTTPLDTTAGDNKVSIQTLYVDRIANMGFMGLGAFYTSLSNRNTEINEQLAKALNGTVGAAWEPTDLESSYWSWFSNLWTGDPEEQVQLAQSNLLLFSGSVEKASLSSDPKELMLKAVHGSRNGGQLTNLSQAMGQLMIETFRTTEGAETFPNPILEMRTVGNTIQNVTFAIMVGTAISGNSIKGKIIKEGANFVSGGNIDKLTTAVSSILMGMFGLGFFYANIVPNLPYIMWSLAVFSYLSYATMMVIGAGWWGGSMTMGNERNFAGRAHEGGNILVTLALQPTLMTMSFFLAMILNIALGYYLQWTMQSAAVSATYGGLNIFSFFGTLLVNAVIMLVGVMKNLSLIWELTEVFQRMLSFKPAINDKSHEQAQGQAQSMSSQFAGNMKTAMSDTLRSPSFVKQ